MLRIMLISLALAFAAPAAPQEKKKDEAKKPTAQQQKHADCNRKSSAKKLKGEERKQFMTECLKT
jgi:psiF repeat-containing protein